MVTKSYLNEVAQIVQCATAFMTVSSIMHVTTIISHVNFLWIYPILAFGFGLGKQLHLEFVILMHNQNFLHERIRSWLNSINCWLLTLLTTCNLTGIMFMRSMEVLNRLSLKKLVLGLKCGSIRYLL